MLNNPHTEHEIWCPNILCPASNKSGIVGETWFLVKCTSVLSNSPRNEISQKADVKCFFSIPPI